MDNFIDKDEPQILSHSLEVDALELPESAQRSYDRFTRFIDLFEKYRGSQHLIILQGTPDPDAISSALALDLIGGQFEIETTILTFKAISHHENRTLVKRLGINLHRYEKDFDFSGFASYSIVDSQKWQTPIERELKDSGIEFFAFFDHHKEETTAPPALFVDVRTHVASAAAILTEYLQVVFSDGLSSSDAEHVRVATALMHGMRTDTKKFALATEQEYRASAFLAHCVDVQAIDSIEKKVLAPSMLDMFERAFVNRRIHDNFVITDVGFLRGSDRDAIPQITELLLAREGTDTVLVFGIVDEQIIDGSLRTCSESINPDEFLKSVLGVSPESGLHYGGGNIRDKGGFQIPLGFFSMCEDSQQVYQMVRQVIETKFLNHTGRAVLAEMSNDKKLETS